MRFLMKKVSYLLGVGVLGLLLVGTPAVEAVPLPVLFDFEGLPTPTEHDSAITDYMSGVYGHSRRH